MKVLLPVAGQGNVKTGLRKASSRAACDFRLRASPSTLTRGKLASVTHGEERLWDRRGWRGERERRRLELRL
jgi:hypothetical protein